MLIALECIGKIILTALGAGVVLLGAFLLACGIIVVFQLIFPRRVKGRQITSVRRWD